MKSKKFAFLMLAAITTVLGVFSLLHQIDLLSLPHRLFLIMIMVIAFIFISGLGIMFNVFYKEPDVFVNRFMILTTLQFLTVLSILGAVWYKMPFHLKAFGFQFICLFITLMVIQSAVILRINK